MNSIRKKEITFTSSQGNGKSGAIMPGQLIDSLVAEHFQSFVCNIIYINNNEKKKKKTLDHTCNYSQ